MIKDYYEGNVWKFGDNVSTDSISPGRLMYLRSNPEEYAKHVLEDANPEFAKKVKKDDFIVAGNNFGCGSSREIAPLIIKIAGVGAILAKSFARIFYRNAINNGMLLIQCDTSDINEGDKLKINLKDRVIENVNNPEMKLTFTLSKVEEEILKSDGLLNFIENKDLSLL